MAEKPLAYWLALVDRLVEERFSAALDEHGVTRVQWGVLGVLSAAPATAAELDATDGDAADELAELVESGWVTAGERYEVTERGAAAYERLADVVDALRETLTSGVSEAEQTATVAVLERMAANLGYAPE